MSPYSQAAAMLGGTKSKTYLYMISKNQHGCPYMRGVSYGVGEHAAVLQAIMEEDDSMSYLDIYQSIHTSKQHHFGMFDCGLKVYLSYYFPNIIFDSLLVSLSLK